MECSLLLTTLSGVTFKVSLSVAKFDRFEDLEDQVMDYLASVTNLKVFGCVIDFLQTTTQTYLEDPIWDKLQQGMEYTIVFRNCSVILPELGGNSIDQVPLAVHVPMNPEEIVQEWPFAECRNTQMARCLCGRKCFRHLSGCEMAILAAYDPGHGLHPWSRMKKYPPIHNCHGPAVTLPESECEP